MLSELYFQDFCVVFHRSNHLDDHSLFEAYIRPLIVTPEDNLKLFLSENFDVSPLGVLLF